MQSLMFPDGQDLPLFSFTPPFVVENAYRPTERAQQPAMLGITCRACMDTGRIGPAFCFCEAGDRAHKEVEA